MYLRSRVTDRVEIWVTYMTYDRVKLEILRTAHAQNVFEIVHGAHLWYTFIEMLAAVFFF